MLKFYPWVDDDEDDALAWIEMNPPEIGTNDWKLSEGVALSDWFPADVTFDLSDEHGPKLADSIPNTEQLLIVSERLKKLLQERSGARFEFFPVTLRDPKKRRVKKSYFLANLLDSVACLDAKNSQFVMSSIDPTQVMYFTRLALDEKKIPPDAKMFRLGEMKDLIIIRDDLADDLLDADMSGMYFQEMDDYGSEFGGREEN